MKLSDILSERLNHSVYYTLSAEELASAFKHDAIKAQPAFDKEHSNQSYYFIKTTPSPDVSSNNIVLKLDGNKLNADLKAHGTDYFINDKNQSPSDKIYTKNKILRDFFSYVDEVLVLVKENKPDVKLKNIADLCKEKSIPIHFYSDEQHLKSNNRTKNIDLNKLGVVDKTKTTPDMSVDLEALLYLNNNSNPELPSKYSKFMKEIVIPQNKNAWIRKLKKDVSQSVELTTYINNIIKNNDCYSLEELVNKISQKWKTLIGKKPKT